MLLRHAIALLMLGALAAPAVAESGPHSEPEPEWEVTITPYVWLPGVDGEIATADTTTVDLDISQLTNLLNVNYFGFLKGEVRRGRWMVAADGLLFNINYEPKTNPRKVSFPGGSVSGSFDKQRTVNVGGANHQIGPIDVSGNLEVDVSGFDVFAGPVDLNLNLNLIMGELMGGYRLFDVPVAGIFGGPVAADDHRSLTLDAFAGARYWNVKGWADIGFPPLERSSFEVSASAELSVAGGGRRVGRLPITTPEFSAQQEIDFGGVTVPAGTPTSGGKYRATLKEWWVDPVIGLRAQGGITKSWSWVLSGDIGGFGIGSASKLTWQTRGGLVRQLGERWNIELALRALEIDRESADTTVRVLLWGPMVALSYRF